MISRIYTRTAGEIITEALRDAKIIAAEQPVNAIDYSNGLNSLNNVSKFWQTKGVHLWLMERAVLPLNVGQKVYELGPDGDPCGYEDTFYSTTLDAAGSTSDTTLTVDSTVGMEAAPDILDADPTDSTQDWTATSATLSLSSGLRVTNSGAAAGYATYELDATVGQTYRVRVSNTIGTSSGVVVSVLNSTTVEDTATLSSSTTTELTITASLDTIIFKVANTSTTSTHYSTIFDLQYVDEETGSRIGIELDDATRQWTYVLDVDSATQVEITTGLTSAAAVDNSVYSFVDQIDRPLKLFNFMFGSQVGVSGVPVNHWSRQEYMQQPDKSSQGTVVNWFYNPTLAEGKLYVWQTANNVSNLLYFDVRKPLAIYNEISDELDFPAEYLMALKWGIAADVAPSYGVPENRQIVLETKAVEALESALDNDNELDSIYITPNYSGG